MTTLADYCEVTMGQAPHGATYNTTETGLPLIAGASDLGKVFPAPSRWTNAPTQTCREGDVVLCIRATIGDRNWADRAYCLGRGVAGLRARPDKLEPRYLWHWLDAATPRLLHAARGATFLQVNRHDIESLPCSPPPSIAEQRRIADILDKADEIRTKRRESAALLADLLRAGFLDVFGDPVANPMTWPTESIDELCSRGASLVDGPFGSSLKPEHYVSEGVKVVRNWNINDDHFDSGEFKYVTAKKFDELRRSEVLAGDVLITTKGTVGDVCVAPDLGGPSVLSASGTVRLRVPPDDSYLPEFIVAQMTVPSFKRYLHTFEAGTAQQYLNLSAIRKMRLIRPPMEKQREFSRIRAGVRSAVRRVDAALSASEQLFRSLVAELIATRDR
ncbi:restriction endonuclease subunit S [Anaeromyxobacter sp. Red801]|uniref:restriction endonuclease subunit S n=1 Tax=Anaeromyxobacter sp. Red801 TaxID=3411632 RepID=UPI003B9EC214